MNELFIHDIGTVILTTTGIIFNVFLLFVIVTDSTVSATEYKKMLAIVAIYNIHFSIVHKIVEPVYLIDKYGFICISKNFANSGSYWSNYLSLAFYGNSFAQSLSLLGVHCFFRYSMITGQFKNLFNTWWGISCCVLFLCTSSGLYVLFLVAGMKPSAARDSVSAKDVKDYFNFTLDHNLYYYGPVFNYPDENGVEHFRFDIVAGSGCLTICGAFYLFICGTGVKLYLYIKKAAMSTTMRRIQLQLLYVLLAQAISPLLCEFLPALIIIYGGVIGVVGPRDGIFASMFISGYSPLDAFLTLALFKAYRIRALEILAVIFLCFKKYCNKRKVHSLDSYAKSKESPLPQAPISASVDSKSNPSL